MIQFDEEQYWLYAFDDHDTNRLLHVRLYPTLTSALFGIFVAELLDKHRVDDALFLIDGAP